MTVEYINFFYALAISRVSTIELLVVRSSETIQLRLKAVACWSYNPHLLGKNDETPTTRVTFH
jgi:hypothetical protein